VELRNEEGDEQFGKKKDEGTIRGLDRRRLIWEVVSQIRVNWFQASVTHLS